MLSRLAGGARRGRALVLGVRPRRGVVEEVEQLRARTVESPRCYVELARRLGLAADFRMAVGTDGLDEGEEVCAGVAADCPRSVFFPGKLVFREETLFQRLLHNERAYRLQLAGLSAMVLPVRVAGGRSENNGQRAAQA